MSDQPQNSESQCHSHAVQAGWAVRRLMPIECERLQGFPDGFTNVPWREGFNAVLIEREPEYQKDIAERMRLCMAGPDEKRREIIKRRGLADDDAGPLFGGAA